MEAEVVVWRDEERLEQVARSEGVELVCDVDRPADHGDGAVEPEHSGGWERLEIYIMKYLLIYTFKLKLCKKCLSVN